MTKEVTETSFDIPIISGCNTSPEVFDFSFRDIKIVNLQSKEFNDYIKSRSIDEDGFNTLSMLELIYKEIWPEEKQSLRYAIIPNDPFKKYKKSDLFNVANILLIIFPSDLQIKEVLHFFVESEKILSMGISSYDRRYLTEYPGSPFDLFNEKVPEINEFINEYFDRLDNNSIVGLAVYNYLNSYQAEQLQYVFASLFTALDSIIAGVENSMYKMRRGIAILLGDNEVESKLIFKNVNELYKFRNSLFHGNDYPDYRRLTMYIPKMRSLVSRVIIELLIHGINKDQLNNKFTELGFGDRKKISTGWKKWELNEITQIDVFSSFESK